MNLCYVEQVNRLTKQIIDLREEADRRSRQPPHPRQGPWRHKFNIDRLRLKAEYLEKKRLVLFGTLAVRDLKLG